MSILISLCILLLIAYVFDLTASRTKIPSVVLLLLLGWTVKQITAFFKIEIPDLTDTLPVIGTMGLILIVLEGSLELELNKSKISVIKKSSFGAVFSLFALTIILANIVYYFTPYSLKTCLINIIPFCVISSAIAIPSVQNLTSNQREFTIYESSLSDIFGVVLFNFIAYNTSFGIETFGKFFLEIVFIAIISLVATIFLSFLLNKIDHHIKFVPIILLVILIYEISKIFHLPALIFIMIFGLAIGNIDELKEYQWTQKFRLDLLNYEVAKFKELTIEGTFLVRALFFILFGYLMKTSEITNLNTLPWAFGIVVFIFAIRAIQLYITKVKIFPLLFVAPRGLITILLLLSISPENKIPIIDKSLIIQVILLTAITLMIGLIASAKHKAIIIKRKIRLRHQNTEKHKTN